MLRGLLLLFLLVLRIEAGFAPLRHSHKRSVLGNCGKQSRLLTCYDTLDKCVGGLALATTPNGTATETQADSFEKAADALSSSLGNAGVLYSANVRLEAGGRCSFTAGEYNSVGRSGCGGTSSASCQVVSDIPRNRNSVITDAWTFKGTAGTWTGLGVDWHYDVKIGDLTVCRFHVQVDFPLSRGSYDAATVFFFKPETVGNHDCESFIETSGLIKTYATNDDVANTSGSSWRLHQDVVLKPIGLCAGELESELLLQGSPDSAVLTGPSSPFTCGTESGALKESGGSPPSEDELGALRALESQYDDVMGRGFSVTPEGLVPRDMVLDLPESQTQVRHTFEVSNAYSMTRSDFCAAEETAISAGLSGGAGGFQASANIEKVVGTKSTRSRMFAQTLTRVVTGRAEVSSYSLASFANSNVRAAATALPTLDEGMLTSFFSGAAQSRSASQTLISQEVSDLVAGSCPADVQLPELGLSYSPNYNVDQWPEPIKQWLAFFNRFGTHVRVKSEYGASLKVYSSMQESGSYSFDRFSLDVKASYGPVSAQFGYSKQSISTNFRQSVLRGDEIVGSTAGDAALMIKLKDLTLSNEEQNAALLEWIEGLKEPTGFRGSIPSIGSNHEPITKVLSLGPAWASSYQIAYRIYTSTYSFLGARTEEFASAYARCVAQVTNAVLDCVKRSNTCDRIGITQDTAQRLFDPVNGLRQNSTLAASRFQISQIKDIFTQVQSL